MLCTCPNCQTQFEQKQTRKKREVKVEQITFDGKKFEGIKNDDERYWREQFPAVNIELELHKMEAWLYANPKNRKKKYVRFITNWLSKSQDKAPRVQHMYGAESLKPINTPSWKSGVGA